MVRVVTQETYDEVVKENIEEFDMTPEEAVTEAIAQFEAQGVDLSNIIKDLALGDGDAHIVTVTVTKLSELSSSDKVDDELLLNELLVIQQECNKDLAHRMKAAKDGAYNVLIQLLDKRQKMYLVSKSEKDAKVMVAILNTLTSFMDTQPDLLDNTGVDLIMSFFDIGNEDILQSSLQWACICCVKHEMNRTRIFSKSLGTKLKTLLSDKKVNVKVISGSLQLMRKMTLDDDIRVPFGKASEHARELGVLLLEPLTELLKEHTVPPLVSELMLTIAALSVRHELCKVVSDNGKDVLFSILADNFENSAVIQQANKLITALAGNDDVKRALVSSGIIPIMISLLKLYMSDTVTAAILLKCMAALSLREPGHSQQFLENGVPEVIVECLKNNTENAAIVKNACWAIRNMVSRCKEHNTKFHELGIESLLKEALELYNDQFGFDIKSALRDLECDVKFDEQWTGKGVQMDG